MAFRTVQVDFIANTSGYKSGLKDLESSTLASHGRQTASFKKMEQESTQAAQGMFGKLKSAGTGAFSSMEKEGGNAFKRLFSTITSGVSGFVPQMTAAGSQAGKGFSGALSGGILVGVAAIGTVLAGLALKGVSEFVQVTAQVRAFQRVTGESAETSSKWVYAAGEMGIQSDTLAKNLLKFANNLTQHTDKFDKYNVAVAHSANGNRDVTGTLLNVAEAYQKTDDPGRKAAMVIDLLGARGAALIPILQRGKAGLAELFKEAEAHHLVFNQEDLQRGRDFTLATKNLGEAFKGLEISLGEKIVPLLTTGARVLADWVDKITNVVSAAHVGDLVGWFEDNKAAAIALGVVVAGPLVASFATFLIEQAQILGLNLLTFWGSLAEKAGAAATAIFGVDEAIGAMGAETALATTETSIAGIAEGSAAAAGGLGAVALSTGLVVGGIAAVGVGLALYLRWLDDADKKDAAWARNFVAHAGTAEEATKKIADERARLNAVIDTGLKAGYGHAVDAVGVEKARAQLKALDDAVERHTKAMGNASEKEQTAYDKTADKVKDLGDGVISTQRQMDLLGVTGDKAMKSIMDGADKAGSAVLASFEKSTDVLAFFNDLQKKRESGSGSVKAAVDKQAAAEQALADLQDRQSAKTSLTIADQQALKKAHDAVAEATNGVATAQANLAKTGGSSIDEIAGFYEKSEKTTTAFVQNINTAIQQGYDPNLIASLLKAGPEQAAPFLETLVSDHTGRLKDIVNKGQEALDQISQVAVRQARVLQIAMTAPSEQAAIDVPLANRIIADSFAHPGDAVEEMARRVGVSTDEAKRVVTEFGLQLDSIPPSKTVEIDANTTQFDQETGHIYAVLQELDGKQTTVYVTAQQMGANLPGGFKSSGSLGSRAVGGPVEAGRTYLIGEEGPELFVSAEKGFIIPNDQLSAAHAKLAKSGFGVALGFAGGIDAARPDLSRTMVDLVQKGVIDPVEAHLEIASPSKRFQRYGASIMDGLIAGMKDREAALAAQMRMLQLQMETPAGTTAGPASPARNAPTGVYSSATDPQDSAGYNRYYTGPQNDPNAGRPGYVQAASGSWRPTESSPDYVHGPSEFWENDHNDPDRGKPGYVQAEDGSWVGPSFYSQTDTSPVRYHLGGRVAGPYGSEVLALLRAGETIGAGWNRMPEHGLAGGYAIGPVSLSLAVSIGEVRDGSDLRDKLKEMMPDLAAELSDAFEARRRERA